jgi:mannose-6-phosphate isomerase-like protein (cupin superfamily)
MREIFVALLLFSPVLWAMPTEDLPAGFAHWDQSFLEQAGAKLEVGAASDPHHFAVQQLGDYPNDSVLLVRRKADGPPEWHETQVDVMLVQSGSATLVVGGTLVNGETVAPHEKRNGTIEGGDRMKISAGDIVRIPPRTPHQILLDGTKEFDYVVVKVKGY